MSLRAAALFFGERGNLRSSKSPRKARDCLGPKETARNDMYSRENNNKENK